MPDSPRSASSFVSRCLWLTLCCCAVSLEARAQAVLAAPRLLADLNAFQDRPASPREFGFTSSQGTTWFFAAGAGYGTELHRTTGSPAGTQLVADLSPGPPSSTLVGLTAVGARAFFGFDDGVHGLEPWVSDGSAAGTRLCAELVPGAAGMALRSAHAVGSRWVFFASTPASGYEPWSSDGTAAGTFQLADIAPGSANGIEVWALAMPCTPPGATQPQLLFLASDGPQPYPRSELWITDGTIAGTRAIGPVGGGYAQQAGAALSMPDGRVIFVANRSAGASPISRWVSDGTSAGTTLLATNLFWNAFTTRPMYFDGRAWFLPRWFGAVALATDGTVAGTVDVTLAGSRPFPGQFNFLGVVGNALWASGVELGVPSLYRCDAGATQFVYVGTLPAAVEQPWYLGNLVAAPRALVLGNRIVIGDRLAPHGLFAIDPLASTWASLGGVGERDLTRLFLAGTRAFTALEDGAGGWLAAVSDGTPGGTVPLGALRPDGGPATTRSSDPIDFIAYRDQTLFSTNDGRLWISDGSAGGTRVLAPSSTVPEDRVTPAVVDGRLYLSFGEPRSRTALWVSDGTAAGTRRVSDLAPSPQPGRSDRLLAFGHELVFERTSTGSAQLAASDGTTTRTLLTLPHAQRIFGLARVGDRGLCEVLAIDGQTIGTSSLWAFEDRGPGPSQLVSFTADPQRNGHGLVVFRDRAWFTVEEAAIGTTLWSSDGTAAGTRRVSTFGGPGRTISWMKASDTTLWLGVDGQLRRSDGANPTLVTVSMPSPATGFAVSEVALLGDALAFAYRPALASGLELWLADPLAPAARRLAAIERPVGRRLDLTSVGRRFVCFVSGDPTTPVTNEATLWVSDGTAAGTRSHSPLQLGPESAFASFAVGSGKLWFAANLRDTGTEPWSVELSALALRVGEACGGAGSAAELYADGDPVQGTSIELEGRTRAATSAVLLFAAGTPPSIALPLLGRCELWVTGPAVFASPTLATSQGAFRVPLAIPTAPALSAATITVQAVLAPGSSALGVELSNAVVLRIGR
ncbi:MAG: hypothetical protein IT457_21470 [Planctomycetes bacterium]|nr:hypothetical protein [Planctomycetota bacterium]